MKDVLLITISGADQPGVTSTLMTILAAHDVNVLDIGQAVIHDTLSLGVLVEIPEAAESSPMLKDILFQTWEKGLTAKFRPVSNEDYSRWVGEQGKARHIVTLLARKISADHVARLADIVAASGLNIDRIERLSGRVALGEVDNQTKACVELSVRGALNDAATFRSDIMRLASELDVDIAYQEDDMYRRTRRLVAFDMDSTLIEAEVIDELAKIAGVGDQVASITERAMAGELDFDESFTERLALLEGMDASVLDDICESLPLTEGAHRLVSTLNHMGYKTAILSGGFDYFGRYLQKKLGIDYVHANQLDIVDGRLTGKVKGKIVNGTRKAELLEELAKRENISLQQCIAVGDGANDLPMLGAAGLGIAFRAKPLVNESAKHHLSTLGLDGILYLLGISDRLTDS